MTIPAGTTTHPNERDKGVAILHGLEAWIGGTGIKPGDRLPPERELSTRLGVSRAELRKALIVLEANGAVVREVGRGTTFLGRDNTSHPLATNLKTLTDKTSPHEAMMARLTLEPQLAGMAAIHASLRDLYAARELVDNMRRATSWAQYEQLDATFHEAIAKAAGNTLLLELHRIVNAVRVTVVWARLDVSEDGPPPDYHSFAEHDAILSALERRDKSGASHAMRSHLMSTRAALLQDD